MEQAKKVCKTIDFGGHIREQVETVTSCDLAKLLTKFHLDSKPKTLTSEGIPGVIRIFIVRGGSVAGTAHALHIIQDKVVPRLSTAAVLLGGDLIVEHVTLNEYSQMFFQQSQAAMDHHGLGHLSGNKKYFDDEDEGEVPKGADDVHLRSRMTVSEFTEYIQAAKDMCSHVWALFIFDELVEKPMLPSSCTPETFKALKDAIAPLKDHESTLDMLQAWYHRDIMQGWSLKFVPQDVSEIWKLHFAIEKASQDESVPAKLRNAARNFMNPSTAIQAFDQAAKVEKTLPEEA